MGAFNTLTAETNCPSCGKIATFDVQFKFGDTWQHRYHLNQTLRWGGNDKGLPGKAKVLVDGVGGPCPHCNTEYLDFDIVIEHDRIVSLGPLSRELNEIGFLVLQD
jgi:hypothetical protein